MSIKRILVPITVADDHKQLLALAVLVARTFNSHVQCVYPRNGGETHQDLLNSFGSVSMDRFQQILKGHSENIAQRADQTKSDINQLIRDNGLLLEDTPVLSDRPSASWQEISESITDFVGFYGGVMDLIVVGRPQTTSEDPAKTVVGAALFASGRPVLVAPSGVPKSLDHKVLIGWNCSIQAGRAVASALPFLRHAKSVEILSIMTGAKRGPSALDLAEYLAWHGIKPDVKEVAPEEHRSVGEILLTEANRSGADVLVMGAYSHSRLREMLWGGVTRQILSNAQLPVLMVH
ncbi:MAG: universal stress protein [Geminicoccaceae bacterium]